MKIAMTGGGSGGHVMVGQLLIPMLRERGHEIIYYGSRKGLEREMILSQGMADYHMLQVGKLRRYFSLQNVLDFFRVWVGLFQALVSLRRERPDVIFSGGGYVSLPVVIAGRLCGIPALIRETDCSMGLANRICARFSCGVYATFPGTLQEYGAQYCGLIVRPALLEPPAPRAPLFPERRPTVLIVGGSQGAVRVNRAVWDGLDELTARFNVVHACGRGKGNPDYPDSEHYRQIEYIEDMAYFYSIADVVITRSGSNAVCECLALGKRMLCIPLVFSRGEQAENARFAAEHAGAAVLRDKGLTRQALLDALLALLDRPAPESMRLTPGELAANCARMVEAIERAGEARKGFPANR